MSVENSDSKSTFKGEISDDVAYKISSKSIDILVVKDDVNHTKDVSFRVPMEVAVFLTSFAFFLSNIAFKSEVLRLTCEIVFNYSGEICTLVEGANFTEDAKQIEETIQQYSANIFMTKSLTEGILAGTIAVFLGSWSDKFGRKPVLLLNIAGASVYHGLMLVFSMTHVHPWIYATVGISNGIVGGVCTMLGISYCYMADISDQDARPLKLAILSGYMASGVFLGTLSSGFLYAAAGASVVFATSTVALAISFCYVKFFIRESLSPQKLQKCSNLREYMRCEVANDIFKPLIKARENYARFIIFTCVVGLCAFIMSQEGSVDIMYLFARQKFSWSIKDYSTYSSVSLVVMIIGGGLGIYIFQKLLKFSMPLICMIATAFNVIDYLIKAFAEYSWELYLGVLITLFRASYIPIARSILSNVVSKDEIGKLYAMTTAIEFLIPVASSPVFTLIYKSTLEDFPGSFNLISAALFLVSFILFIFVYSLYRRNPEFLGTTEKCEIY